MLERHLTGDVRARALSMFSLVAEAEAFLHNIAVEKVAFHEVGAIDSVVDIVGVAAALSWLRPARVTARPVPLGHGFVQCAHGRFPVPAPAALEILRRVGAPVEDGDLDMELCTPTGAAILAAHVEAFSMMPPLVPRAVGYGAGDDDPPHRPNLLRVILGEPFEPGRAHHPAGEEEALVVEANIDDMVPELCEPLLEVLLQQGARDVWFTPIVMKKGRPAFTVSVLCAAKDYERMVAALFAHSTTIGLRSFVVRRRLLERHAVTLATRFGPITAKVAYHEGRLVNVAPEFESCRSAALRSGVPLKEVYQTAWAAVSQAATSPVEGGESSHDASGGRGPSHGE